MERRVPVGLSDLPEHLIQAVLAVEDRRFYDHHGLDIRSDRRRADRQHQGRRDCPGRKHHHPAAGQEPVLSASRSPLRKLREAAMALVLEIRYDKSTILEAYLNEIYLGQDAERAIHGVGAAARYYFGKGASKVAWRSRRSWRE
jgi:penicillin-binding protein 1B